MPVTVSPLILPGDPAPSFYQRTPANPRYAFDTAAGRYIALCFLGSASTDRSRTALASVLGRPDLFNDDHTAFFAVSNDPKDEAAARLDNRIPGFRVFWESLCQALFCVYLTASLTTNTEPSDKFMLRLLDGIRDRMKAGADANNRSMNSEIVATLEEAHPEPRPDLDLLHLRDIESAQNDTEREERLAAANNLLAADPRLANFKIVALQTITGKYVATFAHNVTTISPKRKS